VITDPPPPSPVYRSWGPAEGSVDLYVIEHVRLGDVKIGRSSNVEQRLKTLAQCSPAGLRVLHVGPGLGGYENSLHRRFSACRTHGEWFGPDAGTELRAVRPDDFATWVRTVGHDHWSVAEHADIGLPCWCGRKHKRPTPALSLPPASHPHLPVVLPRTGPHRANYRRQKRSGSDGSP
jgi:hypothetical protein